MYQQWEKEVATPGKKKLAIGEVNEKLGKEQKGESGNFCQDQEKPRNSQANARRPVSEEKH